VFLLLTAIDQLNQGIEVERESAHGFSSLCLNGIFFLTGKYGEGACGI
jgi:hypothetical protein